MTTLAALVVEFFRLLFRLSMPGGFRKVICEQLLLKHQLIVISQKRKRCQNLRSLDRVILGFLSLWLNPRRLIRSAVILSPATLLRFHKMMVNRKYKKLFSPLSRKKPGPKGPSPELIKLIVKLKGKNPSYGCQRIAHLVSELTGDRIDDQTVRRILRKHLKPIGGGGPSWLTFIGHTKDSLWSLDLFCCESVILQTYWVLVVMDHFTRKAIGFSVHKGPVDGAAICLMFARITTDKKMPKHLSFDNDPIFRFTGWKRNLRLWEITPIRSVPICPVSHPFIERLIRTVREEFLNHILFWNKSDLEKKLTDFQTYYNRLRTHYAHLGKTPDNIAEKNAWPRIDLGNYQWKSHCRGLYQLPMAA